MLGQDIITLVDGWKDVGYHEAQWQDIDCHIIPVPSRVYFSIFKDGHQVQVVKMILVQ